MNSFNLSLATEKKLFFKRWLRNPLSLGAILPSSSRTARFLAKEVWKAHQKAIEAGGCIVEIGAGTGCFTAALLESGIPPKQLIAVELDKRLFEYLKTRFPNIQTVCGDAQKLEKIIPSHMLKQLTAVVSGIPMVSIPKKVQSNIMTGALKYLRSTGAFYQFTYSPFSSIPAKKYGLKANRLGTVFFNVPPATIWSYKK